MLGEKGFDAWAHAYDESVRRSEAADAYPFAGYDRVMDVIFSRVVGQGSRRVLDLGFGTAALTARLCEAGCEIFGQDFSGRMVEIAREKMPGAHLYQGDLADGLVSELGGRTYDAIVATYSLHHLDDARKTALILELTGLLAPKGCIHIGDVAFETRADLEACRRLVGDAWDTDEVYFVCDELRPLLPGLTFERASFCAGVITIPSAQER